MKKLITTDLGGFPFVLNDLRWMEAGITETVNALVTPYLPYSDVPGVLRISGLDLTIDSGSATVSPGYVYINNEIYSCAGLALHTVVPGNVYRLKIQTSYDSSGSKLFQSGVTHDAYAIRVAELVYEALSPVSVGAVDLPSMSVLNAIGKSIEKTSRRESGELTRLNDWNGYMKYRVINGVCYIEGDAFMDLTDPDRQKLPICDIPSHLLPYWNDTHTYGDIPPDIINWNYVVGYDAHSFTACRIVDIYGDANIYSNVVAEVYANLSTAVGRNGLIWIKSPGIWPSGAQRVIIKIRTSWAIKPI